MKEGPLGRWPLSGNPNKSKTLKFLGEERPLEEGAVNSASRVKGNNLDPSQEPAGGPFASSELNQVFAESNTWVLF